MKTFLTFALLTASLYAGAAQEGYGTGYTPAPRPGAPVWHTYTCTVPQSNGHNILGVGYRIQVATAALAPEYNVKGCILASRVVYPNAKWKQSKLNLVRQDANEAVFSNQSATVTIDKNDSFSAVIEFTNGATSNCTMAD